MSRRDKRGLKSGLQNDKKVRLYKPDIFCMNLLINVVYYAFVVSYIHISTPNQGICVAKLFFLFIDTIHICVIYLHTKFDKKLAKETMKIPYFCM